VPIGEPLDSIEGSIKLPRDIMPARRGGQGGNPMNRLHMIAAGLLAIACAISQPVAANPLDELYTGAQKEKELVIYAGGPTAPFEALIVQFNKVYPDVHVSIKGGFSNVLNQQIEEKLSSHAMDVDMGFFQTVQDFVAWKKRDVLLAFKAEGFERIPASMRDEDGTYMAIMAIAIGYAYNTKSIAASDVPRSALDFLKPAFKGKMISVYPHDDDAALYLFYTIVQKYGWDWMTGYIANQPYFVQGHLPVARGVADGTRPVSFDGTITTVGGLKRQGEAIETVFSEDDETPVFTSSAGIFKEAPHPNAAKLFLSWYLAPEQQGRLGTFSPRDDVPPPTGFKPLASYKIANGFRDFMANGSLVADLRARFLSLTGPVVNQGGVR
jgi:ABC-type Fe3+ transport system substrate-binding protein